MGFVIEILSDPRLNLVVQIGSRLTRYDTHTTTHTGSRLGWSHQPDYDTLTHVMFWYGKATGQKSRGRERERKRLAGSASRASLA